MNNVGKIAIIGGGAYSWTPELVRDFAVTGGFGGARVHLMDISPEPLKMAETLCRKIIGAAKADITVASTLDRHEALDGADIVLVSINTGGSDAYGLDVDIPLKYGIRSSVGDTAGPSGISRSLRNIPVVSDIAKSVREICPRAYLINVTNPMGTLTRAMRMQHERTVGYCHEVEWLRLRLAWRFGVPREQVQACTVGVNHMTWVTALKIGDNLHGLELLAQDIAARGELNDQGKPTPVVNELYGLYGALPVSLDAHIAEFYGPYSRAEIAGRYSLPQSCGLWEETHIRQRNRRQAEGMLSGAVPISLKHSMEQISEMVLGLRGQGAFVGIGNLPNVGQVDNLPRGAVLETPVVYDWDMASPMTCGPLRPVLASALMPHCVAQELTVEAVLRGDRKMLIEAMLTLPHICDFAIVPKMVDDMLQAHRKWLPQFFQ